MKSKQLYLVAGFIQAISGFIVLPFVLNNTSLEQFGKYLLFMTISGFLGIFLNLGLHDVIAAYYTYWSRRNIIYENIALLLTAMFIQSVFISILLFTLIKIINIAIFSSDFLIIVVLVLAFLQTLQLFFQAFFRMNENANVYFISTVLFVILDFIFKMSYLTNFEYDLEEFLFVSVAPYIFIYVIFFLYILVKYIYKYELNIKLIQIYYRYSLSMFMANLVGRTTSVFDKPLVVYLMGYEVFAVYGLAQKFNNAVGGFRIILKNIWIADAIKNFNTKKSIHANKYMLYAISGAVLSAILLLPMYVDLFIEQKLDRLFFNLVTPLILLNILWVYYYFHLVVVIKIKKSKHMPKIQLLTSVFYLSSLFLVVYFDIYGIVIALYVQMISLILLTRFYYKRFINYNYLITKELIFILLTIYSIGLFVT
jgi:O-antigen/teichoic acid export membrane protein